MPVDDKGSSSSVADQSGETVQLKYNSSGTLTNDAGQAAGVVVMGKFTYNNILNLLGDMQGKKGDTSLTFTCTALTTEVGVDVISPTFAEGLDESSWTARMAAIGAKLTNGQYWVDYANGVIYGKKTTTASTMTSTAYKYYASAGAGSISSIVPGTGATNLGKAEDAVHASGDVGVMTLSVRKDTAAAVAGADGDYQPLITNSTGHQHIAEGFIPAAEDNANAVIGTQNKPLAVSTYAWSLDASTALEASSVAKASAGVVKSVSGRIDSTHATATYYYQILNHASLPSDGAVNFVCAPLKIQHTNGTDSNFSIDFGMNGVYASTGVTQCLSTTEFTKTISGAYLSTNLEYK